MGECLIVRGYTTTEYSATTATPDVLLEGYTCYVNDELVAGTMPDFSDDTNLISPDETISLEKGYYSNFSITIPSIDHYTVGTTTEQLVLDGYNGWVNGQYIEGCMPLIETYTVEYFPNETFNIPIGWHDGTAYVVQNMPVQHAVSITPSSIDQIICDAAKWTIGDLLIVGDNNLISDNIRNGVDIFGTIGSFKGWVDDTYEAVNWTFSKWIDPSYGGVSAGSYSSNHTVYQNDALMTLKKSFSNMIVSGHPWGSCGDGNGRSILMCRCDSSYNTIASQTIYGSRNVAKWETWDQVGWVSKTFDLSIINTIIDIWATISSEWERLLGRCDIKIVFVK